MSSHNNSILVRQPAAFDLVKYGGYCADVVAQNRVDARADLMKAIKTAKSKGMNGDSNWNRIHEQLVATYHTLSGPHVVFPQYKAHVLSAVICPYIAQMSNRRILAPTRYQQVSRIIALLNDSVVTSPPQVDTGVGGGVTTTASAPSAGVGGVGGTVPLLQQQQQLALRHPVHMLLEMDEITREVTAEAGLWPSDLAAYLNTASQALWAPILRDVKTDAQSLALKFIAVGLVDAVGKPLLLAYPLWLIVQQALKLVQAVEVPALVPGGANAGAGAGAGAGANALSRIDPTVVLQITKAVLLLLLVQRFITLLELFSGAGQVCLVLGLGLYALTLNTSMLKQTSPALVQHLGMLATLLDRVGHAEQAMCRAVTGKSSRGTVPGSSGGGSRPVGLAASDRVEEISESTAQATVTAQATGERGLPVATAVLPATSRTSTGHVRISSGDSTGVIPIVTAAAVVLDTDNNDADVQSHLQQQPQWSCSVCTYDNETLLHSCEMCHSPRNQHDQSATSFRNRRRHSNHSNN